jgi:hypothetical protein
MTTDLRSIAFTLNGVEDSLRGSGQQTTLKNRTQQGTVSGGGGQRATAELCFHVDFVLTEI